MFRIYLFFCNLKENHLILRMFKLSFIHRVQKVSLFISALMRKTNGHRINFIARIVKKCLAYRTER